MYEYLFISWFESHIGLRKGRDGHSLVHWRAVTRLADRLGGDRPSLMQCTHAMRAGLDYKVVMKIRIFACGSARRATSRKSRGEFIAASCRAGGKVMLQISAMSPGLPQEQENESNIMTKLLGVIAIAAVAFAVVPAQAAKHSMGGCSGANLEKTETAVENMADGDSKFVAEKEITAAQDAMLNGKMSACGMHLNKAMQATMGK
jgi:hypothetical protein